MIVFVCLWDFVCNDYYVLFCFVYFDLPLYRSILYKLYKYFIKLFRFFNFAFCIYFYIHTELRFSHDSMSGQQPPGVGMGGGGSCSLRKEGRKCFI